MPPEGPHGQRMSRMCITPGFNSDHSHKRNHIHQRFETSRPRTYNHSSSHNSEIQAHESTANCSNRRIDGRRRKGGIPGCLRYGPGFLRCRALTVADSTISTMYSTKEGSMTIPISVHSWHKKTNIQALLDSEATHNFIDKRTIQKLALETHSLPQPCTLHNIDGTNNCEGSVTHFCNLWVQRDKQQTNWDSLSQT